MKNTLILFLFLFTFSFVYCGEETYVEYLSPSEVSNLETSDVFDSHFQEMQVSGWQNNFINHSVKNKVWIGYEKGNYPMVSENPEVKLFIEYWTYNGTAFVYNSVIKTLELTNDQITTNSINDISTFNFVGAHRVKVQVLEVLHANSANIFVKSAIEIERNYLMETNISNAGYRYPNEMQGYLEFFWDIENGAENYELEWTYISNHDFDIASQTPTTVPLSDLFYDFYKNSTRVRLSDAYYRIPKTFNQGYIIFRVRAIGRMEPNYNFEKFGNWSLSETGNTQSSKNRFRGS